MTFDSHISITPEFAAGDPPPDGYLARQAWAAAQLKAGLRQERCVSCSLYRFPQEMSETTTTSTLYDRRGREVESKGRVCLACTPTTEDSDA